MFTAPKRSRSVYMWLNSSYCFNINIICELRCTLSSLCVCFCLHCCAYSPVCASTFAHVFTCVRICVCRIIQVWFRWGSGTPSPCHMWQTHQTLRWLTCCRTSTTWSRLRSSCTGKKQTLTLRHIMFPFTACRSYNFVFSCLPPTQV